MTAFTGFFSVLGTVKREGKKKEKEKRKREARSAEGKDPTAEGRAVRPPLIRVST
jgi:hypothetical protein